MEDLQLVQQVVEKVVSEYTQNQQKINKQKYISRLQANSLIEKVIEEAENKCSAKVVVGVTSKEGHPISIQCMDDAFLISYELVLKKCFTSVALQMPTHELGKLMKQGAELEGLEGMTDHKIVGLGGGYPLYHDGELIGAIAVSGSTAAIDTELAYFGSKLFERG